uniref:Protein SMG5 n=1 Tax=Macrostomum lignano TaxID=282301 RepID=A0A1I8IGD5_9PLAT
MEKVTYRVVEECISRLNEIYHQHPHEPEVALFCPDAASLRHRLKSTLLKIIFLTPADFGAKGEDILWRKGFYEVLACIKKYRQSNRLSGQVEALYRAHLISGLGFYNQLLSRVLLEYPVAADDAAGLAEVAAVGCADFAPAPKLLLSADLTTDAGANAAAADWARGAVHRCLMHIGDLYRYLREFQGEVALALVQRYYGAAARFEPMIGLPYNQLGTLDVGNYYNLTAVYYYLRCLACEQPFEGSRRNLAKILNKNQRRFESLPPLDSAAAAAGSAEAGRPHKPVKQFAVRFVYLIGRLLQPHQLMQHQRRQNYRQLDAELNALCQSVLAGLSVCLSDCDDGDEAACLAVRASEVDPMRPHRLADSAVLQAALAAVLCLDSLAAANSRHAHACTAFCLGLFACVLRCALARCRHALQTVATAAPTAELDAGEPTADDSDVDEDDAAAEEVEGGGEDEDEDDAAGDFHGFSAPRLRRRRRRRRRRRGSGSEGDAFSSSGESSDCQLAFGYDEDDEEVEGEDGEVGREGEDSNAEDEAAMAAADPPSTSVGGGGGLPSFCFSYGIPSALMFHDEENDDKSEAAELGQDGPPADAENSNANVSTVCEADAQKDDSTAAAAEAVELAISRVRLLQTVKLLLDWMLCQPHLLSRAVQSSCLPLWDSLSALLNLLPAPPGEDSGVICPEPERSAALPEDAHARGLRLFQPVQRHLDFAAAGQAARLDESRLRLAAIRRFGFLAVQNDQLAFEFDSTAGHFLGPTAVAQASRDAQMRNLAQLRLINQVQQLESAVSQATPAITSSHAIPSRRCLTDGLDRLKALVSSRRCILVLPRSSIDYLDRLKQTSQAARRASRFLETELQSGRGLINTHDYPSLTACAKQLAPATTVFLICRGESPPQLELPFPVRELHEFVRQALAPGQAG